MHVKVTIPLPVKNLFTYSVPPELRDSVLLGKRVLVEFGKTRLYAGIITEFDSEPDESFEIKEVIEVLDEHPILKDWQIHFFKWIAEYYMCSMGEVMAAALPSSLQLKSESLIHLKNIPSADSELTTKERFIVQALLNRSSLNVEDASKICKVKNVKPLIKKMIDKDIVFLSEKVDKKYKPLTKTHLRLSKSITQQKLEGVYSKLEKRAFKQLLVLMKLVELARPFSDSPRNISKKYLLEETNASHAITKALIDKEILEPFEIEVSRFPNVGRDESAKKTLSPTQQKCLKSIERSFQTSRSVLLHGVTGSGKTEIYIKLIEDQLEIGKRVLYLVPEIAITTQLVVRLQKIFGEKVGVFHSQISSMERHELWMDCLIEKYRDYKIVIGARSALFLPIRDLGLIIIDEEHDASFKQYDPAPRYHARNAALQLAKQCNLKVVLGSATPSFDLRWLSENSDIVFVELKERYGLSQMPEIQIVDLKNVIKKKKTGQIMFSPQLVHGIEGALNLKQQIILFQNRRGYVPFWKCETCGTIPECENCDVSLTYHREKHKLICHYCGTHYNPPQICHYCGSSELKMLGFGTEKVEDELQELFPSAKIQRMDYDTTRGKYAHQKIIDDFEKGEIDILVGTQMVTKGLDFERVSIVGILNADALINWPDFRSAERAFQLMVQVAGRAGRKKDKGVVLIQTYQPDHPVVQKVVEYDYEGMFQSEIAERKAYKYPPFYRLIKISLKHSNNTKVHQAARYFNSLLISKFGNRVLGPEYPMVARVKRLYIQEILIKIERKSSLEYVRTNIEESITAFRLFKQWSGIRIIVDVDPI